MAVPAPFADEEIEFLRGLVEEGAEFLVVGLAAAALQGAAAVTQDIDLWFRDLSDPKLHAAFRKLGVTYVPPSMQNPPLLVGGGSELFDLVSHMHGLGSFDEEASRAIPVTLGDVEVAVLPLARIIHSKRTADRPKDRMVLSILEDTLRTRKNSPDGSG